MLLLFAVCQLIGVIITLATIGAVRDATEEAYRNSTAAGVENIADFVVVFGVGTAIFTLVVALALVGLGLMNLRGKNGSRIATWIVGGIMTCCVGFGVLGGLAGGLTTPGETSGDAPSSAEVQRQVNEALPGWANPVSTTLAVISLLALLGALILLALPKANEFFRKPAQQWEPPMPGASYPGQPGQPGYPAAPGYPPAPGYPGTSPAPGYPPTPGQPGTPGPSFGDQSGGASGPNPPAGGPEQPGGETPPTNRPG
ncbi:hypothetical protein C1I93_15955 [Micromonospora endophytica]|uniref:Uncharacterized protein n=1 Tax=Micromonospora endophytica TaxID=515350 RepID=A0A2W2D2T1_9ACTN|nr:hypothetical protein C1I93_15955 [Micromonospora endophytica]RIW46902.1 hypothetical protein D3H59_11525 [Micromonospora endophytica]